MKSWGGNNNALGTLLSVFVSHETLKIFHKQCPDSVEDGDNHYAYIRKHGQPHIGETQRNQYEAGQFYADGHHDVLIDDAKALAGDFDCFGDLQGVIIH